MLNLSGQALVLLLAAVASATTLAQDTYAAPRQAMVDEIRAVARGAATDTGRPTIDARVLTARLFTPGRATSRTGDLTRARIAV
ncbi:MAG: hypothetical protein ABWY07_10930 [Burkholderiales bacterium]